MGVPGLHQPDEHPQWSKQPYDVAENGGITGVVIYTATRGFDDPRLEVQFNWEP